MTAVRLVEDNSLRATKDGYELRLRLLWYRSLPLSCIEKLDLSLDGQPIDPAAMRLEVNGTEYGLDDLADRVEDFWFVQDSATLRVKQPGKVAPGGTHTVDVEMAWRYPYIVIGPGKFLTNTMRLATTQVAG